jgi:hypothetical protein
MNLKTLTWRIASAAISLALFIGYGMVAIDKLLLS